jgi:hypothetical protein
MDHLAMPYNPKKTYIAAFWFFVDMTHDRCVFPGDGSYPLVLTHSTDVAQYIERLVGLPASEWPRQSLVASNKIQVKDLEPILRKITGEQLRHETMMENQALNNMTGGKLHVTYDSEEAIRRGHITQLPSNRDVMEDPTSGDFYGQVEKQIMLSMFSRAHILPGKDLAEIFPDVETTDVEAFLKEGWAMKQGTLV